MTAVQSLVSPFPGSPRSDESVLFVEVCADSDGERVSIFNEGE